MDNIIYNDKVTVCKLGVYQTDAYGTTYYWCHCPHPEAGLDNISFIIKQNEETLAWCDANFGPMMSWDVKNRRWFSNNRKFYFLHERDRTLFLMRWV